MDELYEKYMKTRHLPERKYRDEKTFFENLSISHPRFENKRYMIPIFMEVAKQYGNEKTIQMSDDEIMNCVYDEKTLETIEKVKKEQFRTKVAPKDIPDGLYNCPMCVKDPEKRKKNLHCKTEYFELQTRSIDEASTKFCFCHICSHKWKTE